MDVKTFRTCGAVLACLFLARAFVGCHPTSEAVVERGMVRSSLRPIDVDPAFAERVGREALATIGYIPIMNLARQASWVTSTERESSPGASRAFISMDGATATAAKDFVEVFSRYAVAAGVTSQADSPLPGPGDAAAIGVLVIGLIDAGLLEGAILATLGGLAGAAADSTTSAPPVATSTPTATPVPTVTAPPVAITRPRKYPNQTCEDEERVRLGKEMDSICKSGYAASCSGDPLEKKSLKRTPCSAVLLSLQQRLACLNARWRVQNECFGGKPDVKHKEAIDIVQKGINNCEALKLINCAKGHPQAGK